MLDEIFDKSATLYRKGAFTEKTTFYFSIDEVRKTVVFDKEGCTVFDGKQVEDADCVCRIGSELFMKIFQENYRPGMKEFMSGAIKSNSPQLLQQFLAAFGR